MVVYFCFDPLFLFFVTIFYVADDVLLGEKLFMIYNGSVLAIECLHSLCFIGTVIENM